MASRPRLGMAPGAAVLVVVSLALLGPAPGRAQDRPATNPLAGDANAIRQGQNIYRGRCAVCHGIDAKGYRGSDLTTGDWVHGGSGRPDLQDHPRPASPGTEMPGNRNMSEDEVWMLVAYLRTLSAPGGPAAERGDAARGEQLFWAEGRRQLRPVPHDRRPRAAGSARICRASAPRGRRRRSSARFAVPAR